MSDVRQWILFYNMKMRNMLKINNKSIFLARSRSYLASTPHIIPGTCHVSAGIHLARFLTVHCSCHIVMTTSEIQNCVLQNYKIGIAFTHYGLNFIRLRNQKCIQFEVGTCFSAFVSNLYHLKRFLCK